MFNEKFNTPRESSPEELTRFVRDKLRGKFDYISNFIHNNDNFIITAHETPDGDAIGSESAMYCALKSLGKNVLVVNADLMAEKYTFLDYDKNFRVLNKSFTLPGDIAKYSSLGKYVEGVRVST